MGCDIHLYKEKQVDGKWLTADEWETYDYGPDDKGIDVPYDKQFTDRNYELFGLLSSGVRRSHPFSFKERGMPFDVCEEVKHANSARGSDGHSHSYLYVHELRDMLRFLRTTTLEISGMKDREELASLRESIATGNPDWVLLFPYCQWGTGANLEEFSLDVPATFYVGDALERIIASFAGTDGGNHRIVFWFDN